MTAQMTNALATLAVAAIFVAIFYFQSWIDWPRKGQRGYRRVISFSAGAAVAYVFVHLLPELATASEKSVHGTAGLDLPFPHHRVYLAALLGFMVFYGLEHMVNWSRLSGARQGAEHVAHDIHYRILAGSYALYVLVVSYLMAHEIEAAGGRLALFALAMGLHFLGLGHGLRRDCPSLYDGWGRYALAGAAIAGWAVALLMPLSDRVAHTLLGFVAGAVMMNTATSELPVEKEGRFFAFATGGVAYTAILLHTSH